MFTLSTSTISELGYEHGRDVISRWNSPADWSAPNAPDGQGSGHDEAGHAAGL
jgi:probable phosphoglycerate mutase